MWLNAYTMIYIFCYRLMYLDTYCSFLFSIFKNLLQAFVKLSQRLSNLITNFIDYTKSKCFSKKLVSYYWYTFAVNYSFRYWCTLGFSSYCFLPCPKMCYQLNLIWTKVQMKTTISWWKKFIDDSYNEAG